MPTSIITLPTSTVSDLLAYAGALFTDLSPVFFLLVGVPFGFWLISKIIGLVRSGTRTSRR